MIFLDEYIWILLVFILHIILEVFWLSDDVGSDVFQLNVGQAMKRPTADNVL